MINQQRVRRIKNFIYALIIVVLFLPLILMSVLSLRMIKTMHQMSNKLDELQITVSQQSSPPASDSGYVIEPEGQSVKNGNGAPQVKGEDNSKNVSEPTPNASGDQPEAGGAPPGTVNSNVESVSTNDGAAGINGAQSGTLDSDSGRPLMNPGTGNEGYNGNPLTGQ